jgi:hypothetical protein
MPFIVKAARLSWYAHKAPGWLRIVILFVETVAVRPRLTFSPQKGVVRVVQAWEFQERRQVYMKDKRTPELRGYLRLLVEREAHDQCDLLNAWENGTPDERRRLMLMKTRWREEGRDLFRAAGGLGKQPIDRYRKAKVKG